MGPDMEQNGIIGSCFMSYIFQITKLRNTLCNLYLDLNASQLYFRIQLSSIVSLLPPKKIDWREIGKFLAVMVPQDPIEAEGLENVIPKRKKRITRKITINDFKNKHTDKNWSIARKTGRRQKRKKIALVISTGVNIVMSNHTYM